MKTPKDVKEFNKTLEWTLFCQCKIKENKLFHLKFSYKFDADQKSIKDFISIVNFIVSNLKITKSYI